MIGSRLKEERKRLGFSQDGFADVAGITRRPYAEWEAGRTSPTGFQLAALANVGADVTYILTGEHSGGELTAEEKLMLDYFRAATPSIRRAAMGALLGAPAINPQIGGENSHHSSGDGAVHIGTIKTPRARK